MAEAILPDAPTPRMEPLPEPARKSTWSRLASIFLRQREASIFIVAILLVIYFQFASSNFLTGNNIRTVFEFVSATTIIAAGEVMLLICGEIDLSVGQMFALAPYIMYFVNQAGLPVWVGMIAALLVSAIVGLLNGIFTVWFKIPSLITTMGMLFLLNGVTLTISGGEPFNVPAAGQLNQIMG
ncbi:MAG TPA: ABC transporter permease, partial [Ktedonobacteraceae bacterium]|nr:ABC transporter permease [Ktedonobacteraceae bacterium]